MNNELNEKLVSIINEYRFASNDEKMDKCEDVLKEMLKEDAPLLVSVYKSDDNQNIAVQLLTNQDGMQVISMFTSEEESKKAWETATVELGLKSVLEAVRDSGTCYDGVVINPFSDEISIYKSHLTRLFG